MIHSSSSRALLCSSSAFRNTKQQGNLKIASTASLDSPFFTISTKMAIGDKDFQSPNAPHGVTSHTKAYNDWPNDAGVCQAL